MPTVMGLFRSSMALDKAVNQLISQRFQGYQLRVVPMHETEAAPQPTGVLRWFMNGGIFGDTLDRADGRSVMDGIAAGATIGGLGGVTAGAAFLAGPITCGTLGILGGGLIGYIVDRLIPENRRQEYAKALRKASTLVLVECDTPAEADSAEQVLRENQAHEVGRLG